MSFLWPLIVKWKEDPFGECGIRWFPHLVVAELSWGPDGEGSMLTFCPASVFSSRKPCWKGSWGLLITRACWHLQSEKADSEDLSSRMLLQYISGWRKEQGGMRRLPCQCLQNLDDWQAEHQVNCSWSRKSGVEEAGVGRWLPSFEITGFAPLCFLLWTPLSP